MASKNRYFIMEGGGIDSLRGFGLEVGRAEAKHIIRKDGFLLIRLGLIHELTPEEAREQAAERLREIRVAKGKSSIMSGLRLAIAELAQRYHEAHADRWTPKTIEEYNRLLAAAPPPPLGSRDGTPHCARQAEASGPHPA